MRRWWLESFLDNARTLDSARTSGTSPAWGSCDPLIPVLTEEEHMRNQGQVWGPGEGQLQGPGWASLALAREGLIPVVPLGLSAQNQVSKSGQTAVWLTASIHPPGGNTGPWI